MTVSADFFGRDYRTMENPDHPSIVRNDRARSTARADSVVPKLVETVTLDDANRKIKTFAYTVPGARKSWMDDFRAEPLRMMVLDTAGRGKAWGEKRAKQLLADEAVLAQVIAKHGVEGIRANLEV